MINILKVIKDFFQKNYKEETPLLLALSGGPDSRALFECLVILKEQVTFEFHVAHINHNWRFESEHEAQCLKDLCIKHAVPFHLHSLHFQNREGNLEEVARLERLNFYKKLNKIYQFGAVLLGHQRDDQIETVLKRVLEGANLAYLKGMQEISYFEELVLWRPLLTIPKTEIYNFLRDRKIDFFEDSTNKNEAYLRARMRHSLIPHINHSFGKEIGSSLIRISKYSQELYDFLDPYWHDFKGRIVESPLCVWIDFSDTFNQPFLMKYFLRKIFKKYLSYYSEFTVEAITEQLLEKRAGITHRLKNLEYIEVDRGHLFIRKVGQNHVHHFAWNVYQCSLSISKEGSGNGWRQLLKNTEQPSPKSENIVNEGYDLLYLDQLENTQKIRKWFGDHKVPHFLTSKVPLLCKNQQPVHEFLTGKFLFNHPTNELLKKKYYVFLSTISTTSP